MASILDTLGRATQGLGDLETSLQYLQQATQIRKRVLGVDNYWYGVSLNDEGFALWYLDRYDEAAESFWGAVSIYRRVLGPDHPLLAIALRGYGGVMTASGHYSEAMSALLEAKAVSKRAGTWSDAESDNIISLLGLTYGALERHQEALPLLREAADRARERSGPTSPRYAYQLAQYAFELRRAGDPEEAARLMRQAMELVRRVNGSQFADLNRMTVALADALCTKGPNEEGFSLASHAIEEPADVRSIARRSALPRGIAAYCDPQPANRAKNELALQEAIFAIERAVGSGAAQTRDMVRRMIRFYEFGNENTKAAQLRHQLDTRYKLETETRLEAKTK
jgi:tetratricopeptide (TPR) repeat protein